MWNVRSGKIFRSFFTDGSHIACRIPAIICRGAHKAASERLEGTRPQLYESRDDIGPCGHHRRELYAQPERKTPTPRTRR